MGSLEKKIITYLQKKGTVGISNISNHCKMMEGEMYVKLKQMSEVKLIEQSKCLSICDHLEGKPCSTRVNIVLVTLK